MISVDRNGLFGSLALIRYQLETAAIRLAEMTEGVEHPHGELARSRLQAASVAVMQAAGGLSWRTHTWLGVVEFGGAGWAVAAFTGQFVGLSGGWTVAITTVVVAGLTWPVNALNNALAQRVNRRRTKRPDSSFPIVARVDVGPAAEVLALLRMARDGLTVAMKQRLAAHRYGHVALTAAGFDWLCGRDPQMLRISLADRQLCQVIFSIELWLPDGVGER